MFRGVFKVTHKCMYLEKSKSSLVWLQAINSTEPRKMHLLPLATRAKIIPPLRRLSSSDSYISDMRGRVPSNEDFKIAARHCRLWKLPVRIAIGCNNEKAVEVIIYIHMYIQVYIYVCIKIDNRYIV